MFGWFKKKEKKVLRHNVPNGYLIGYKKVNIRCADGTCDKVLAILGIPETAHVVQRFFGKGEKVRAEFAFVLGIEPTHWGYLPKDRNFTLFSGHDRGFKYKIGEIVYPDSFDADVSEECTNGIHFFLDKRDADDYPL